MTRPLSLVLMPFHAATFAIGMGRGPHVLAARIDGDDVTEVEAAPELESEIARTFELDRRLARSVREVVAAGSFPLVLSGNCISCLGTVAGAGADAVLWLDAHADFDTPDDNVSGFLDVMALASLTGNCWAAQCASIEGFRPIAERDVVLVGVRDLLAYQRARLERSQIRVLPRTVGVAAALDALASRARRLYLHVDLDCLDPSEGRANDYAAPGGLTAEEVRATIAEALRRFDVRAAALTAYDPAVDADGRIATAAAAFAAEIRRSV